MTDETGETADGLPSADVALPDAALPDAARDRLAAPAVFTSDLSVNEFLLVRQAGFRPLGLVLGCSVYHVAAQAGQLSRLGRSTELEKLTQAMYHARELAMTRMQAEAQALGADGVVGVRLEIEFRDLGNDIAEFLAVGTAVVADGPPPTGSWRTPDGLPFTSDLSGQEFWTLLRTGYAPLGLVMGTCVYRVARRSIAATATGFTANSEIVQYTGALYEARELAMGRMQAEATALGAEGVVGVRLLSLPHRWGGVTTEFFAIGTAVRPMGEDHTVPEPALVLPLGDGPGR